MFNFNHQNIGFDKGNAYSLGLCAALVYEDWGRVINTLESWGIHRHIIYAENGTEAFLAIKDNYAILSFRGTKGLADFITDARCKMVPETFGRAHEGFVYGLDQVWDKALQDILALRVPLWITGHSLGAALATLAIGRLRARNLYCPCYTFGSPRVGNDEYAQAFASSMIHRYVNNNDMVTNVPLELLGYKHVDSTFHYFTEDGKQQDDITWWGRKKEKWKGIINDIGEIGADALKDHGMINYNECLERALRECL